MLIVNEDATEREIEREGGGGGSKWEEGSREEEREEWGEGENK